MSRIFLDCFRFETVLAILLVVRYGFIASTESDSLRKGKAYLIASLSFSLWLFISPLLMLLYNASLPIFEFDGTVVSIRVLDSDSRHYSAALRIRTTLGGSIDVHASDLSPYFRSGQRMKVRYRGDTGELIKAHFYTPEGRQEGVFNGLSNLRSYSSLLLGLFLVWASLRKFNRDPKCAEEAVDRNSDLSGSVDEESLLHLSKSYPDERL